MASEGTSSESRVAVERFDGKKNFNLWQMRMRDVLVQHNIEDALFDKEDRPKEMTDKTWDRANSRAVSTIRLHLSDDVVYDVMGETQAKSLWEKLGDLYMGKNLTNRLMLKQELYSLKRKEGVELHTHIGEFNKLLCDLSNVGVKLDDEDKAIILLTSVKSTHKYLFDTLLYGRDSITLEQVKKTLLSSEKLEVEDDRFKSQALAATHDRRKSWKNKGGGGGGRDSRLLKDRECYYCGEKGHMIRDCPEKKKRDAGLAATVTGDVEHIDDALSITEQDDKTTEWVLDSACSSHLCSQRDAFSSYQPMKGNVFMGNGSVGEVNGVGTVRIKTTNGLTRTLTDVRHVPSLRRNVISLGRADSKGCSIAASNGLMKIRRGSRIMLMGRKVGNLYVLLGNTIVVGEVAKGAQVKWEPIKKPTVKAKAAQATLATLTTSTKKEEDVGPSKGKAKLMTLRVEEDALKSLDERDLRFMDVC